MCGQPRRAIDKDASPFNTDEENPLDPSPETHALKGNLKGSYACSITHALRIIFILTNDTIHLLNIDSHDEVYSWRDTSGQSLYENTLRKGTCLHKVKCVTMNRVPAPAAEVADVVYDMEE
ncbi:MAG: type II toxin-antitoxin system YafQ family toxin [Nitrospirae bacterium]|nr:type II toxin-antitoxin system YafQ family toxin [Nitrospirota bacterium]